MGAVGLSRIIYFPEGTVIGYFHLSPIIKSHHKFLPRELLCIADMAVFNYSISRPITMRWFTPTILILGVIYVVIITFINIATVGYDTIAYTSTDFNVTHNLWFDNVIPSRGSSYNHRKCDAASLALNDRILLQEFYQQE